MKVVPDNLVSRASRPRLSNEHFLARFILVAVDEFLLGKPHVVCGNIGAVCRNMRIRREETWPNDPGRAIGELTALRIFFVDKERGASQFIDDALIDAPG